MRQTSLFATGSVLDEPDFSQVTRLDLGRGAWIDHGHHVLPGADEWLQWLVETLPWRSMERPMYDNVVAVPRLVAFFTRPETATAGAWTWDNHNVAPAHLERLACTFERRYARPFRSIGCNWYRNGQDSVAWHADRVANPNDALIAIIGVGERRPFLIRPKGGGPSTRFLMGDGDLLVLGGTFQANWEHCVPKISPGPRGTGERVSIMVRG